MKLTSGPSRRHAEGGGGHALAGLVEAIPATGWETSTLEEGHKHVTCHNMSQALQIPL